MDYIHRKFRNLYKQRLEWIEAEDRSRISQKQRSVERVVAQQPVPQREPAKNINPRFAELE